MCFVAVKVCHPATAWAHCWRPGQLGQTIKTGQSQRTETHWKGSDMVKLCVSISDVGLRLESAQKESHRTFQSKRTEVLNMATLKRKPRARTGSAREDRGSCSSTASCPGFSGPYSDQEEEHSLRRQSSPVLNGSLSSLCNSISPSSKGSLSSFQGSVPCLQSSLPNLQGSLPSFQSSVVNLRRSISQLKRRSPGNLENSSPNEMSTSLQSCHGSSSDDDGSWDTNSWSSGVTCLLRMPINEDSSQVSRESDSCTCTGDQATSNAKPEDEIIYQNIVFSHATGKGEAEYKTECSPKVCTVQQRDTESQGISHVCRTENASTDSLHQQDKKVEDRQKFSKFLNEVTCRVLKTNSESALQSSNLHYNEKSLLPTRLAWLPLYPDPMNPLPLSTSATNLWYSPTSSNLQTIRECNSKDLKNSIHQWSKTVPSCKILDSEEALRKLKSASHSNPDHHVKLCTKIQTQPTTGRFYLETDIDRVRRLDELVANGTLGRGSLEREKKRGKHIPWERNGGLVTEKGRKDREKRKDFSWERDRGEKVRQNGAKTEKTWEQNKRAERGREKEKKVEFPSNEPRPCHVAESGWDKPCPVFSWPEGFPRVSYRSTSLPRPVNVTESDGEMRHDTSSFHDHKDDLRKRLSYTTHKLEMVETEFDSTRQYLETELRRAQEELEKFTEKLRRIQSGYSALQRINQDLEDKICRTSQHHEDEKRALSREIIVLNNHLMEAKITINKLREDNDLYRKDCNLAAHLLHCSKSHYRAHKLSE
ncbi:uncharacterized protein LOC119777148, partial [Cyprinodon tularosa]|uniref:uncharacterized protein LOC119777148 n=1 Tax=Cyprinodon tularosa TaxID=77115 RepID=UPI0018E1E7A8